MKRITTSVADRRADRSLAAGERSADGDGDDTGGSSGHGGVKESPGVVGLHGGYSALQGVVSGRQGRA